MLEFKSKSNSDQPPAKKDKLAKLDAAEGDSEGYTKWLNERHARQEAGLAMLDGFGAHY
jgi:hypothetical protein